MRSWHDEMLEFDIIAIIDVRQCIRGGTGEPVAGFSGRLCPSDSQGSERPALGLLDKKIPENLYSGDRFHLFRID